MATIEPVIDVDAVDAGWLTGVLGAAGLLHGGPVRTVRREVCGTGNMADSYRFELDYGDGAHGPATVVGKFPSAEPTSREFGRRSGYYRNEIRFYQRLAPSLAHGPHPVTVPTPLHAELAADETDFVLLMTDLAPARTVDQLDGCTADEAAAVVEQVAALHARTWRSPELAGLDWLRGTIASFVHIADTFPATVAAFREDFADLVPAEQIDEAARLTGHLDAWKAVLTEPVCLWHSDVRADNLLFDALAGTVPVALLDWQGVGYGRGTIDLPYFLGTSLRTDVRRAHERALVGEYHRALVSAGVAEYSEDACWDDYRVGALLALMGSVFGLGAVRRTPRGDRMFADLIDRTYHQVRDLDSYAALAR